MPRVLAVTQSNHHERAPGTARISKKLTTGEAGLAAAGIGHGDGDVGEKGVVGGRCLLGSPESGSSRTWVYPSRRAEKVV